MSLHVPTTIRCRLLGHRTVYTPGVSRTFVRETSLGPIEFVASPYRVGASPEEKPRLTCDRRGCDYEVVFGSNPSASGRVS